MKVTFLTAGTGSYHCGACMRDNTLVSALHQDGHEVALLPLYLPILVLTDSLHRLLYFVPLQLGPVLHDLCSALQPRLGPY